MKCQFGYRKVRYRGIAKNGAKVFALLALANLFLARKTLASADEGSAKSLPAETRNDAQPRPTKK